MTDVIERVKTYQQFIGGEFVDSASGETLDVENPANGQVIAKVPASADEDVNRAVEAADKAFQTWRQTTPQDRSLILLKIADSLDANADEFGRLESANAGKPVAAAIDEIATCADLFRFFAGAARVMDGLAANEFLAGHTSIIRRDPIGVVASIAPWNYPLYMASWKLGPALATGNTVVLKPSIRTPLTRPPIRRDPRRAPAGRRRQRPVWLRRDDRRRARRPSRRSGWSRSPATRSTGKRIAQIAAGTVKRLHLELGGKAPVIIFDDADLDLAAETLKAAGYWNSGQDCTAATRVIAGPGVYDVFVVEACRPGPLDQVGRPGRGRRPRHGLADRAGPGRQGRRAWSTAPGMAPRSSSEASGRIGRAPTTSRPSSPGPDQKSEIIQDEIFGPVVTVQRFSDEDQAVAWANDTPFGLASSVFTSDIGKAMRVAKALDFGHVWINEHFTLASETPHGGVKQSGYGKDGSKYALEDYTFVKHVMINTGT